MTSPSTSSTVTAARPDDPSAADHAADAARLRVVVGRLSRLLRQHNPGGLTQGQLSALVAVEAAGPIRMTDLAVREGVAAPTMTRIVAALEDLGLVTRMADPEDGRSSLVELAPRGEANLRDLRARRDAVLARRVAALGPRERAALAEAIPALETLLDLPEMRS